MAGPVLRRMTVGAVVAYCAFLLADIWLKRDAPLKPVPDEPGVEQVQRFWDFDSCYYTGLAWRMGRWERGAFPYPRTLRWCSPEAGRRVFAFLYHPVLLWLYAALSRLPYESAYGVFLALSALAIAGVVVLWRRAFLREESGVLLAVMCLFGFDSALYIGLAGGNINTFDTLLLWLALYFFVQDQPLRFTAAVVAMSLGKGFPALFLLLGLLVEGRRKWVYLGLAGGMLAAVHGGTYAANPPLFRDYLQQKFDVLLHPLEKSGQIMPSTLQMLKGLYLQLAARGVLDFGEALVLLVVTYLGCAGLVLGMSGRVLHRAGLVGRPRRRALAMLAVLVYALLVPHFKDYSYAWLIPPAVVVISRQRAVKASSLLALIVTVPYLWRRLPGISKLASFLVDYTLVLIAYGLWILYLSILSEGRWPARARRHPLAPRDRQHRMPHQPPLRR